MHQLSRGRKIRDIARVKWYHEWYGHVCRRDKEEDINRISNISVEGKRKRGRPKHW